MKDNPIKQWLKENGRSAAWLATQVGCRQPWLSTVANGNGRPSPILASAIERVTGIPASAWVAK